MNCRSASQRTQVCHLQLRNLKPTQSEQLEEELQPNNKLNLPDQELGEQDKDNQLWLIQPLHPKLVVFYAAMLNK